MKEKQKQQILKMLSQLKDILEYEPMNRQQLCEDIAKKMPEFSIFEVQRQIKRIETYFNLETLSQREIRSIIYLCLQAYCRGKHDKQFNDL